MVIVALLSYYSELKYKDKQNWLYVKKTKVKQLLNNAQGNGVHAMYSAMTGP